MQERDVLDLLLVAVLAVVTYAQAFGFGEPIAGLRELAAMLAGVDTGVYLVLGGVFGLVFLGYLAIYLPRRDAGRSVR
jgi:hypothetical protein